VPLRSLYSGLSYEYIFFLLVYLTTFCCVLYSTLIEYLVEYCLLTIFVVQDHSHYVVKTSREAEISSVVYNRPPFSRSESALSVLDVRSLFL